MDYAYEAFVESIYTDAITTESITSVAKEAFAFVSTYVKRFVNHIQIYISNIFTVIAAIGTTIRTGNAEVLSKLGEKKNVDIEVHGKTRVAGRKQYNALPEHAGDMEEIRHEDLVEDDFNADGVGIVCNFATLSDRIYDAFEQTWTTPIVNGIFDVDGEKFAEDCKRVITAAKNPDFDKKYIKSAKITKNNIFDFNAYSAIAKTYRKEVMRSVNRLTTYVQGLNVTIQGLVSASSDATVFNKYRRLSINYCDVMTSLIRLGNRYFHQINSMLLKKLSIPRPQLKEVKN